MRCPRCESALLDERARDGIVIDVCRDCRGVWLDRGELEKLLAHAAHEADEDGRRGQTDEEGDDDDHTLPGGRRRRPERKRRWFETIGGLFD